MTRRLEDSGTMSDDLLLAIPVFNEAKYVQRVLAGVRRYARHILVIDDGSTDQTPALLAGIPDITVLRHDRNLGYGRSLADAFAHALRHRYRWLITMDADEQHDARHIPELLHKGKSCDADVVSATRYPGGHNAAGGGHDAAGSAPEDRRAINERITRLINEKLGLSITDAFCGFKAYRVSSLRRIRITEDGYAMPLQWWVQVARAGLRVVELPVRLIYIDTSRSFGGVLDDPEVRLAHYLTVFGAELNRFDADSSPAQTVPALGPCALSTPAIPRVPCQPCS